MNQVTFRCVGDLILDVPQVEEYFSEAVTDCLRLADVTIGQIEIPHTKRGVWSNPEAASASAGEPEYLDVCSRIGLNVATLAGNHIFDQGTFGVTDTIDKLKELGIPTCGAGIDLEEARKPAFYTAEKTRVAVLNYNCVGPMVSWATPLKAGCAFMKVSTHYESDKAEPGGAPTYIYTITDPACLMDMKQDIQQAKAEADVVVCAFHMGRMFSSQILDYQTQIAHAAADDGADAVICCHAHNLLGAEVYSGVPIYYGMGHFVAVTRTAMPDSWIRPQHAFRPFHAASTSPYWKLPVGEYGPEGSYYMFNEESRMTMIAEFVYEDGKIVSAGFRPCRIVEDGKVILCERNSGGEVIRSYMEGLCRSNGFMQELIWDEDGKIILFK